MRVVLPASGWLMMAKVRRRAASSDGGGHRVTSMCFAGARWAPSRRRSWTTSTSTASCACRASPTPRPAQAMLDDVIAVTRAQADGAPEPEALVLPEANLVGRDGAPEELASKVFKLHRRGVFEAFSRRADVLDRRRRPDRPAARLLPVAVHLQEPGRVGPAVAPGQLLLPVRAGPADHRRVAGRHRGHPRERLPARAARIAPRAGARARARPAPRRQLRLRRDRRPRHGRRRCPCSWTPATCCCSTAT